MMIAALADFWALDDAALDVYESRLMLHYLRRGASWESLRSTAAHCGMSVGKASQSRARLIDRGLIRWEPGRAGQQIVVCDDWVGRLAAGHDVRFSGGASVHDTNTGVHDTNTGVHDTGADVHDMNTGVHDTNTGVHKTGADVHDMNQKRETKGEKRVEGKDEGEKDEGGGGHVLERLMGVFADASGIDIPDVAAMNDAQYSRYTDRWVRPIAALFDASGRTEDRVADAIRRSVAYMNESGLTVASPYSIRNVGRTAIMTPQKPDGRGESKTAAALQQAIAALASQH